MWEPGPIEGIIIIPSDQLNFSFTRFYKRLHPSKVPGRKTIEKKRKTRETLQEKKSALEIREWNGN
jgi:hypothetical protein